MLLRLFRPTLLLLCAALAAVAQGGPKIPWEEGPCVGKLGTIAEIQVPRGFVYTGKEGAKIFMDVTHNIPSGRELGVLMEIPKSDKDNPWFVMFKFSDIGFVKDDEKDKLDADAILASIRSGTDQANEERRKKGWETMSVLGWSTPPFYDTRTNNLTWSIRGQSSGEKEEVINHSVRFLGRYGYMNVDLIVSPTKAAAAIPEFNAVMKGYHYAEGKSYAEFRSGDKVAAIGLTALVAGGAGAVLAKSGLLGKFWKLLVVAAIAVAGFFKKIWNMLRGKKDPEAGA